MDADPLSPLANGQRLRVMIADEQMLFRDMLHQVCVKEFGHTIVAESGDGDEALATLHRVPVDLLVLELKLPGRNGFEVLAEARQVGKYPRVLVLSAHCTPYAVFRAEQAMVHGFLNKRTSPVTEVQQALAAVGSGSTYFSDSFLDLRRRRRADPQAFDRILSNRERNILCWLGDLWNDEEIAEGLRRSVRTVESHRLNVCRKLGLQSREEAERYARANGFTRCRPSATLRYFSPLWRAMKKQRKYTGYGTALTSIPGVSLVDHGQLRTRKRSTWNDASSRTRIYGDGRKRWLRLLASARFRARQWLVEPMLRLLQSRVHRFRSARL